MDIKKISKRIAITIVSIISLLSISFGLFCLYYMWLGYNVEMNTIKDDLNDISNVSVVNIWGHDDLTLEEVTARVRIKDKDEMVLYGLSDDVFNYPDSVIVKEIGGFSFQVFYSTNSIGSSIDIGKKGPFRNLFPFEFSDAEEVIKRHDDILAVIKSWPVFPELRHHFSPDGEELFIALLPVKSHDRDPIYELLGIEELFEFSKKLPWDNRENKINTGNSEKKNAETLN